MVGLDWFTFTKRKLERIKIPLPPLISKQIVAGLKRTAIVDANKKLIRIYKIIKERIGEGGGVMLEKI